MFTARWLSVLVPSGLDGGCERGPGLNLSVLALALLMLALLLLMLLFGLSLIVPVDLDLFEVVVVVRDFASLAWLSISSALLFLF